jgi:hypothetical protein
MLVQLAPRPPFARLKLSEAVAAKACCAGPIRGIKSAQERINISDAKSLGTGFAEEIATISFVPF